MKPHVVTLLFIISLLFSCNNPGQKKATGIAVSTKDTPAQSILLTKNHPPDTLKKVHKNYTPVFGYRFIITGDFDGDGKKEKLVEHYISGIDYRETNKFYDSVSDYGDLVDLAHKKHPLSLVTCTNKSIHDLLIDDNGISFGLSYLKNEGDLNGDGTDEVSYVVDWTDWSSLNTWYIMTYRDHQWKVLYSFEMWDWQLPDLPEVFNQYGYFGRENKIMYTGNDTINGFLEKDLHDFKGLVKKIKTNKIQIIFDNNADMETAIVDLRHPKHRKTIRIN